MDWRRVSRHNEESMRDRATWVSFPSASMISQRLAATCNAVVMTILAGWLFLAPAVLLVRDSA